MVIETLLNDYFNNHRSSAFLETLMREIPDRMVVLWDGGSMHKGDPIREAAERFRPRLTLEKLPPYAPMLNPVEPLWSWLKYSRLSNFAPFDTQELNHRILRELRAVSDDLGLECLASAAVAGEIVILARAGAPQPLGLSVHVGQRLPLVPPLGTVFLAWSDDDEIDRWLTRVGPDASEAERARYRAAVAAVRARGYSVALEADARARLGRMLAELTAGDDDRRDPRAILGELVDALAHEEYALIELAPSESYRVNHIAAPVFGPAGEVVLALTLIGFRDQLSAEQVPQYAERLMAATRTVTKAIHGEER